MNSEWPDRPDADDDADALSHRFAAEAEDMNECLDLLTDLSAPDLGTEPPPVTFRPAKFHGNSADRNRPDSQA